MTEEVLDKCNERRRARREMRTKHSEENKRRYRELIREGRRVCKEAKDNRIEEKCKKCGRDNEEGSSREL